MIRPMHVHTLFDMSGKVARVTGGSRGLGREMALGCGEAGAAVAITARREKWLRTAEEEIRARGITCLALTCDVSRPEEVQATVAAGLERLGRAGAPGEKAGLSWGGAPGKMPGGEKGGGLAPKPTGGFPHLAACRAGKDRARGGVELHHRPSAGRGRRHDGIVIRGRDRSESIETVFIGRSPAARRRQRSPSRGTPTEVPSLSARIEGSAIGPILAAAEGVSSRL